MKKVMSQIGSMSRSGKLDEDHLEQMMNSAQKQMPSGYSKKKKYKF